MKIKRRSKYLLVGGAIIGALGIIAGSTAAVSIRSNNKLVAKSATTNNTKPNGSNPTKSASTTKNDSNSSNNPSKITQTPDGTTNDSHSVTSLLDTLLSNIINVAKYDEMSSNTVQDAFNVQSTLKQAIKQAIQNEITTAANKFLAINSTYSIQDIIDNIQITLPTTLSALDIEQAQISNVTLSYANTLLENTSNTSNFIIKGFQSTVQSSDIQSINEQIAQMIETNVNKIIHTNWVQHNVGEFLWNGEPNSAGTYYWYMPNALILSGFTNITAGQALNIQSYNTQWINALETQIIGESKQTFTFNNLTFTAQEIAANLSVNVDQYQYVNNRGEICGVTLSYAGINLTFSFAEPNKTIQPLLGNYNQNEINIFGFYGFYSWQGQASISIGNGGEQNSNGTYKY